MAAFVVSWDRDVPSMASIAAVNCMINAMRIAIAFRTWNILCHTFGSVIAANRCVRVVMVNLVVHRVVRRRCAIVI